MPGGLNATQIILMMAVFCMIVVFALIFQRYLKYGLRFLAQGLFGCAGILLFNALLSAAGIDSGVGVNLLSASIVGVLGIPGFITLYFTGMIL